MLRDITIGQYYKADSIIHKLDPRVKLAATVLFIITLFFSNTPTAYIIATIYLAVIIKLSKVPFRYMIKGLKAVIVLIVFTALFNLFFTPGLDVLVEFGSIRITIAGLKKTIYVVIRLIYLILGSSIMTYTTTPNQLTDGIEKAFKPLNKLSIPVHEFALMMSLALRFIPILMDETDKIMKAQSARGADFEHGNIITKAKNVIAIIIPLLVSATKRASDLALAMDARCYHGGNGRTKMKPLKYDKRDYMAYAVALLYFVSMVCLKIYHI